MKSRVQQKRDTADNWEKAVNFTPLRGEIIVYETTNEQTAPMLKVGDGSTKVNALPFVHGDDEPITYLNIESIWTDIMR